MPPSSPATAQQRRSRARRGDGERLREEILEAAEALLIATNDQSALTIRAIASKVGVSPPSIYLHFRDRIDLIYAVGERHFLQLESAIAAAAEGVADPVERLRRRGEAYLRYGLDHPEYYRLLMMSRPDDTPERFSDARLRDTAGLVPVMDDIRAALDAGLILERDPLEVAELLWMCLHGVVSLLISKPEFPFGDPIEVYGRLFELLLAGIAGGR